MGECQNQRMGEKARKRNGEKENLPDVVVTQVGEDMMERTVLTDDFCLCRRQAGRCFQCR